MRVISNTPRAHKNAGSYDTSHPIKRNEGGSTLP